MVKMAISVDFRQRVVDSYNSNEGSYEAVAARFKVGVCSVRRWVGLSRETGSVEKRPHKGRQAKISPDQLPCLKALVLEKPDRTVEELKNIWVIQTGIEMHRSSLLRALYRLKMTVKKRRSEPRSVTKKKFNGNAQSS